MNGEGRTCQNRLALLPEMWQAKREHRSGSIRAGGLFPCSVRSANTPVWFAIATEDWKKSKRQTLRLQCNPENRFALRFPFCASDSPEYQSIMKNIGGTHYEKQCVGRHRPAKMTSRKTTEKSSKTSTRQSTGRSGRTCGSFISSTTTCRLERGPSNPEPAAQSWCGAERRVRPYLYEDKKQRPDQ